MHCITGTLKWFSICFSFITLNSQPQLSSCWPAIATDDALSTWGKWIIIDYALHILEFMWRLSEARDFAKEDCLLKTSIFSIYKSHHNLHQRELAVLRYVASLAGSILCIDGLAGLNWKTKSIHKTDFFIIRINLSLEADQREKKRVEWNEKWRRRR